MNNDLKKDAPGNQRNHYQGAIQPIDYIVSRDVDAISANILKYVARYKLKNGLEDLKKAKWYLEWLKDLYLNNKIVEYVSVQDLAESSFYSAEQCNVFFCLDELQDASIDSEDNHLAKECLESINKSLDTLMRDYE